MNSPTLLRYQTNITNPVPPGQGCHGWIMSSANLGIIAGQDPDQIFTDIRRSILPGKRRITDREIQDAIQKAMTDLRAGQWTPRPRPKPIVKDGQAVLQRIIDSAKITTEVDLWEASPIRLWEEP